MTKSALENEVKQDSAANKKKGNSKGAFRLVMMICYQLRKLILAIPVIYFAFKIAAYNETHLPREVGLFLQNNGEFLRMIDRNTAVLMPLFLTLACLVLMVFSRKALYTWAISIFSLALPLMILVSNVYPM